MSKPTPRERVLAALRFEETDIVPYQVDLTKGAMERMVAFNPDFMVGVENHLAAINHNKAGGWLEVAAGHWQDEWGVIWNRTVDKDIGVVENRVLPEPSLRNWRAPDYRIPGLQAVYQAYFEENKDRFRMASFGFSLFERAWALRGMDALLMDMIESPSFVHELLEAITARILAQMRIALSQDFDCVFFGDDWGCQRGMIMGPALWREFIKPCLTRLYGTAREAGKPVFIHCCGDVKEVLPDLIECGLNVFNPFQPEVMDCRETKRRHYGRLAFYGGISVQTLLPHGTPEEVRRETKWILETLGKGGGYIAAPSHSIPVDVPPENIQAMLEALREQ